MNPGTPAYVGHLCIILRHQKHTSRYICITSLLVKLACFLPPKKLWCDTYVSFFRQEPSTCAPVRAQSCADQNFSSVLSELFLCVFCVFRALAAAREQSRALLFCCARSLLPAEITSAKPLLSRCSRALLFPISSESLNFFFVSSVYSVPSQLLASSHKLSSFTVREACCSQKLPVLSLY